MNTLALNKCEIFGISSCTATAKVLLDYKKQRTNLFYINSVFCFDLAFYFLVVDYMEDHLTPPRRLYFK